MTRENATTGRTLPKPRTELDGADHKAAYRSLNRWLEENTGMPYEDTQKYDDSEDDELMPSPETELDGSDWRNAAASLEKNHPSPADD